VLDGSRSPRGRAIFGGKVDPLYRIGTLCGELCKNGLTDRDAVLDEDSGGSKEPRIQAVDLPHGKWHFLGGVRPIEKHCSSQLR